MKKMLMQAAVTVGSFGVSTSGLRLYLSRSEGYLLKEYPVSDEILLASSILVFALGFLWLASQNVKRVLKGKKS